MADGTKRNIALIGAPIEVGAGRRGCAMGSAALRVAEHRSDLRLARLRGRRPRRRRAGRRPGRSGSAGAALQCARDRRLDAGPGGAAYRSMRRGAFPVFLGGDHSLSMGSVSGVARHAAEVGRPLFVLWLDAHADFNTPATSPSGNMHGMPVAFFCGEAGFDGILPANRPLVRRRTSSSSASARSIRPSATRSACAASTSTTCAPSTRAAPAAIMRT